jgi:hypothetical protein
LIGTNRRACIILDNDTFSSFFDLERGNAQGDTVTPYIFNLAFQILLFKINYDLQIQGIIDTPTVPPELPPLPVEVSTRPHKIFAFADDANALLRMEVSTLNRLKQVLDDFGLLSGLECNVDKTTIMQVGTDEPISPEIQEIGFSLAGEVTVLGCTISGPGANTAGNLENIKKKLQKQVNHWARFNLSLPGRISVAKTMLYSQINYLGCFLPMSNNDLNGYSQIIEKFFVGKLNVARNRIIKPIEMGGLGLFELKTFLDAQRIAWVHISRKLLLQICINTYLRLQNHIDALYINSNAVRAAFKGTVSPDYKCLEVIAIKSPLLGHVTPEIQKILNSSFNFLWAFKVLKHTCSLPLWRVHGIKRMHLASRTHGLFIT